MPRDTMLTVRRVDQQFCAMIDGAFWKHWVYASTPTQALRRLYEHASTAPWRSRIARIMRDYNLGFGPVTDFHLVWGISMATTLPLEENDA